MTSQDTQRATAPSRPLRRRTTDRVIGGVAGGLGDYFNVDPLLFRIGFVGLIIFGGAGLVIYLIAWLLLPAEGHDVSVLEEFLRRLRLTPGRLGGLGALVVFFILVVNSWNTGGFSIQDGPLGIPGAIWALGIIVTGVLLLRRREVVVAPIAAAPVAAARVPSAPAAAAAPLEAHSTKAPPRPRSPLAWYVVGALLLAVGLLAAISQVTEIEVGPGQFFGLALTAIGIGLVVGTWWGRARILILLAILLLPLGVTAAFVTAPLEGGVGDHRFTPTNLAELRDEYRLMGGRLILDLTDLSVGPHQYRIAASVAVGQLVLILPPQASVELHASVGAGSTWILSSSDGGTSLDHRFARHHLFGPTYILDLEAGIGEVFVTDSRINW
jgi:phage shock protein PspC (stress-responsive transcriptional regulator)